MLRKKDGFTYMELMICISIIVAFTGILFQVNKYNIRLRNRSDQINKMTMISQGVVDRYRVLGKEDEVIAAMIQNGDITISDDVDIVYAQLKKVIITVKSKLDGVSDIIVVTYQPI